MKIGFCKSGWDYLEFDEKLYKSRMNAKRNIETTNPYLEAMDIVMDRANKELLKGYSYYGSTPADLPYISVIPKPKHVMLNGDYTTIVWEDGTSTVVKRMKGEKDDPEKAILFAIMKKVFDGNKANLDRYLSEFEDKTIIKEKKDKKKRGK